MDIIDKYKIHRIVGAAAIGGTASVLSGGKFANGAISGAFTQAFNGEASIKYNAYNTLNNEVDRIRNLLKTDDESSIFEAKLRYGTLHEMVYGEGEYSTQKLLAVMGHMTTEAANTRLLALSQDIVKLRVEKLTVDSGNLGTSLYGGGKPATIISGSGGGLGFLFGNLMGVINMVDHNNQASLFNSAYYSGIHNNFAQLFNEGKL
ncbi:hypothetical protein HG263_22115 [Pseudoalteromonas sp. JBTF-M23]|uniref:Uncharacterized protein n=2 Tax=Pseudoalteromonas caenipelagi TaxID=2726988 RepID=A0A849VKM4_9GAMM|nr:hypothetical protein [Pseudoalteromonas caenipelagi]